MLSAFHDATINVASTQALITICEADALRDSRHDRNMFGHDQLLEEIRRRRDVGETTNAQLARLLNLPTPRIADIFATDRKSRKITLDEAKILVDHFGLEPINGELHPPTADTLMPLLDALVPLAPPGRATEQSLRALSEALSYGLALLGDRFSTSTSSDAIDVAARAAVARFREIATT